MAPDNTNNLKWALRSLGPAVKLQETPLTASSLVLLPGSGFTSQWADNSPRVFGTLILPTSVPALPSGPTRVPQPATSWPSPSKEQPAASTQGRAVQTTRLGTNQAYHTTHIASQNRKIHATLLGGTPRAYSLGDGWSALLGRTGHLQRATSPRMRNLTNLPRT